MKRFVSESAAAFVLGVTVVTAVSVGCARGAESDVGTSDLSASKGTSGTKAVVEVASCDPSKAREALVAQESSTVSSSDLIADFQVVRSSDQPDVLLEPLLWKKPIDEDHGPTLLRISPSDVVTFVVGDREVACRQDEECRLPYVEGGTYSATIRRANGDTFQAAAPIPNETRILRPSENSHFAKSDTIDVAWTPSSSLSTNGITLSSFLGGLCESKGTFDWYEEFAAKIPGGYLGQCPEQLYKMRFTAFYKTVKRFTGVAGVLKTFSVAVLNYSYIDLEGAVAVADRPMTRCELRQVTAASESGAAFTEIRER